MKNYAQHVKDKLIESIESLGCVSKVPRAGQLCKPDQARRQIYHD